MTPRFIRYAGRIYQADRKYEGPAIEKGQTSIRGGGAPAVKWIFQKGHIVPGMRVLDWGAGREGRNSRWLREQGVEVFAYDPFWGSGEDGWGDSVAGTPPAETDFDVAFSAFVLNVVPESVEDDIIQKTQQYAKQTFHVTRAEDVLVPALRTLIKKIGKPNTFIIDFFLNEFANEEEAAAFEEGTLDPAVVEEFAAHGFPTGKDQFQRIPMLEGKGWSKLKHVKGKYKIYGK